MTNEAIENLSAVPDVESQDAGTMIINASDMSKKNLQIQSDLLKRGLITPKDVQLTLHLHPQQLELQLSQHVQTQSIRHFIIMVLEHYLHLEIMHSLMLVEQLHYQQGTTN